MRRNDIVRAGILLAPIAIAILALAALSDLDTPPAVEDRMPVASIRR